MDFRCCSEILAVVLCGPPHSNVTKFEILRQAKIVKKVFRFILIIVTASSAGLTLKPAQATPESQGMGLVFLAPKEYEALPSHPRYRSILPESTDLSAWLPEVEHQGSQSSIRSSENTWRPSSTEGLRPSGISAVLRTCTG